MVVFIPMLMFSMLPPNATFAQLKKRYEKLESSAGLPATCYDGCLQAVADAHTPGGEDQIAQYAALTAPFLHSRTWQLAADFLWIPYGFS